MINKTKDYLTRTRQFRLTKRVKITASAFLFFPLLLMAEFTSLTSTAQSWTAKANFGGTARFWAAGFSIGGKGYIGTGALDNTCCNVVKNFWKWDPSVNPPNGTWTQMTDFGGTARYGAVGFSIGNMGYIGTGFDPTCCYTNDFWEYDAANNWWTQKTNFGGAARYLAVGFSSATSGKGYIGTGDASPLKNDFWEFDPADASLGNDVHGNPMGKWTARANFGGTARFEAVGFSIGNKGYIGTGWDGGASYNQDFWEWDPSVNPPNGTWASKTAYAGGKIRYGVGFSIGSMGYIGTGQGSGAGANGVTAFYQYDPALNSWSAQTAFGGAARFAAVGFSIGSCGYIGTGYNSSVYYNDFWEWCSGALPVGYLSFLGKCGGHNEIILQWQTAAENNNDYYAIERSEGKNEWKEIGKIKGAGNNTAINNYQFADMHPLSGINYYRLKQVDYDGSFIHSNIISIVNQQINQSSITIYPNPAKESLEVTVGNSQNIKNKTEIMIYDLFGREVYNPVNQQINRSAITIDISSLSQGMYFLKINNGAEQSQVKFIKQ